MEQEFVYRVNRARHDPAAYQAEQNLPASVATAPPRGPLAINDELSNSSDVKANDMVARNYFAHTDPSGVQPNQLARNVGYPLPDSYPNDANFIESISAGTTQDNASLVLDFLVTDEFDPGLGHRRQLLGIDDFNAANREIGVGFSSSTGATFTNYWAIHIARRQDPLNFVTGVVFDDADGDGRFDAGEGLPGVTITVDSTITTTTNAAGGWSVAVGDGEHSIVANGGSFVGYSTATAEVAGDNVQIDFISGEPSSQVSFVESFGRNLEDRYDVNATDGPSASDALLVINFLGARSSGGSKIYDRPIYLDVSGEGNVSSLDALQVINEMARRGNAESGEWIGQRAGVRLRLQDASLIQFVEEISPPIEKLANVSGGSRDPSINRANADAIATLADAALEAEQDTDQIAPVRAHLLQGELAGQIGILKG